MNLTNKLTHGSLFSGIGGFDLAAQWMGWENVFHCEINPFGQKILKHYWPNAHSYEDITTTDFTIYRGRIDVLSGGFPCQPFSTAGRRKGAEDDRYLWPKMLRAIDEIRPTWVVGENVAGLTSMVQPEVIETDLESQTNLQGEIDTKTIQEYQQYVIETVCSDLERLGYSVQPLIIPACASGAPHRRDRIWFIAYCADSGVESVQKQKKCFNGPDSSPYSNSTGLQGIENRGRIVRFRKKSKQQPLRQFCSTWQDFPTQSPVCGGNDGLPTQLDGITFPKWRSESLKAYGNAVVPQVVYEIFKAINDQIQD